jgi:hypothetical protein
MFVIDLWLTNIEEAQREIDMSLMIGKENFGQREGLQFQR